ncbi:MAG: tRNA-dihydrouridine synthase family protein [Bacteroidales bacterium]|nr:tRNA-dihydrouridine synthase family protein [Bacteroidales bacterium]
MCAIRSDMEGTEKPFVAFAPLQGYTDCVYRRAHSEVAGGVGEYYTPFVRMEGGEPRRKDLRDIDLGRNGGVPTVPQVIARDRDEFARLCDAVQAAGWRRVDLNMGCPFPMQVKAGRGSGLLASAERVAAIGEEMKQRSEVRFSVKMRLGQEDAEECMRLLPILNELPLEHVTMHPRLGKQQYKGVPDKDAFGRFVEGCRQRVVYNGDLLSVEDVAEVMQRWPMLKGVMMGRGLLARPWMLSGKEPQTVVQEMHTRVYEHVCSVLQGDSQILARLHAFWEYQTALLDKKQYKAIMKSGSLRNYRAAIAALKWC